MDGYILRDPVKVYKNGEVFGSDKRLRGSVSPDGYRSFTRLLAKGSSRGFSEHRVVATALVRKDFVHASLTDHPALVGHAETVQDIDTSNLEVHHVNGDRLDNHPGNLVWVTNFEHLSLHAAMRRDKIRAAEAELAAEAAEAAGAAGAAGSSGAVKPWTSKSKVTNTDVATALVSSMTGLHVTTTGHAFDGTPPAFINERTTSDGYAVISWRGKAYRMNCLTAHTHKLTNCEEIYRYRDSGVRCRGYDVHHEDRNKLNNHIDNLKVIPFMEHLREHGWTTWEGPYVADPETRTAAREFHLTGYCITADGRVINPEGHFLRPQGRLYLHVTLRGEYWLVHHLVVIAFERPNYDKIEEQHAYSNGRWHVHHKDGDPGNNHFDNLEVLTAEAHQKLHAEMRAGGGGAGGGGAGGGGKEEGE